tara:strand:+ start:44 stop:3274 length:3231 start_codon:yes stop_codon:yes gene_type:complete
MSIFQETFRPFVFKQLRIREAIVKKGNNLDSRFGKPRLDIDTSSGVKEKMDLPAGSFFTNTVEKQCTIRMSSGVDLRKDNDVLEENSPFENPNDLINEGLAIRYILEGGIPTKSLDFASKRNLKTGGKYASVPRGDLRKGGKDNPNFGEQYGTSYGDPFIRSDAKDGFGLVPMPGIIDANIRTKTAYGSLREAKVNFVCHNRRQLEIMELLYMRPGYPILLEWGWTPYISNEGKKEEYFPYLIEFFKQESTVNNIQLKILNRKQSSGGNYDGFIGYCKNFDIKSREDGGYDCSTEIIAMGEVLEGLKGKREGYTKTEEDNEYEIDNLEHFLHMFLFTMGGVERTRDGSYMLRGWGDSDIDKDDWEMGNKHPLKFLQRLVKLVKPNVEFTQFTDQEWTDMLPQNRPDADLRTRRDAAWVRAQSYLDPFFIMRGEEVGLKGTKSNNGSVENSKSKHAYIRWDLLTLVLNEYVFPDTATSEENSEDDPIPITSITNYRDPLGATDEFGTKPLELLEYSPNPLPRKVKKMATSFTQTEGGFWGMFGTDKKYIANVGEISDISVDPAVCLLPHQIVNTGKWWDTDEPGPRKIPWVFFNLEYLYESYKSLRYTDEVLNDDFTMFDWLKTIWDKVNLSCVNTHNFTLQTELERPNVARVIDLNFNSKLKPYDLFEMKIQSNESIVRDFTFNTTLPSSMGATIAVAAQAPKDIETLDSVTFAAFNQNTRYRFSQDTAEDHWYSDRITRDEKEKLLKRYQNEHKSLKKALQRLLGYSLHILGVDVDSDWVGSKTEASNTIKSIEKRARWLDQHYSSNGEIEGKKHYIGQLRHDAYKNPPERSAIIPLKFTAQMDGIGGIVIGNVFKVQKDRLPMGYQGDEVAFVVMGENQKITAGQDWTTDITGQLVLLDLEKKEEEIIETIDDIPPPPPILIEVMVPDKLRVETNIPRDILIPPPPETQEFVFTDVNFDTDKSILKPEAKASLDKFAEYMNAHPSYTVGISGHTDSVGSVAYNQSLSERRAKAVKDYFINTSGIDPSRLTSRGAGELEPIDTNDTSEGRSNNRRTVFLVQNLDGEVPMNVYFTL